MNLKSIMYFQIKLLLSDLHTRTTDSRTKSYCQETNLIENINKDNTRILLHNVTTKEQLYFFIILAKHSVKEL